MAYKLTDDRKEANGEDQINQELMPKLLQKPELAAMLKTLAQAI